MYFGLNMVPENQQRQLRPKKKFKSQRTKGMKEEMTLVKKCQLHFESSKENKQMITDWTQH